MTNATRTIEELNINDSRIDAVIKDTEMTTIEEITEDFDAMPERWNCVIEYKEPSIDYDAMNEEERDMFRSYILDYVKENFESLRD